MTDTAKLLSWVKIYVYDLNHNPISPFPFASKRDTAKFFKCLHNTLTTYLDTNKPFKNHYLFTKINIRPSYKTLYF
jgi:hypothetical protein